MAEAAILRSDELAQYKSYDAAIFAPIIFPLVLAIIGQAVVYANGIAHHKRGRTFLPSLSGIAVNGIPQLAARTVDAPLLVLMASETIFALFCLTQCIINWTSRAFIGGAGACALQGLYASYYTFASPALCALTALYAWRLLSSPPSATSSPPWRAAVGTGLAIHTIAFLVAALPLLGAGKYLFAVDYCQLDYEIEGPLFSALFLAWFSLSLGCILFVCARAVCCTDKTISRRARAVLALVRACALAFA